jgi:hypothetical protein
MDEYQIGEEIEADAFGVMFKATNKEGMTFLIKKIQKHKRIRN